MKLSRILPILGASLLGRANAQPYHADFLDANSEHALKVEGNLFLEQYGTGYGGDLNVVGEAKLASGYLSLTGMPTGVTGGFHGPVKIGATSYLSEFFFTGNGSETTGNFVVPIGWIPSNGPIEIAISPIGTDPMAGVAYYKLGSTRFGDNGLNGQVTALEHIAFGGGCNVTLLAFAGHGHLQLFLQYDARTYAANDAIGQGVNVQIKSGGPVTPEIYYPFASVIPLKIVNSVTRPYVGVTGTTLGVSTTTLDTDETVLNGKVTMNGQVTLTESQGDISMGIYGAE